MRKILQITLLPICAAVCVCNLPAAAADETSGETMAAAKAFYNRGTDHYGMGDYDAAIKDLSEAIKLERAAPDIYYNRGLSYRRLHRNDEAMADFTAAIQLNANQPSYYIERCNVLIVKGSYESAVVDCTEAIQLSPDAASGYFLRGVALMLNGDVDGALINSVQTLQIEPDQPDAIRLLYELLVKREIMANTLNASTKNEKRINNTSSWPARLTGGVLRVESA